MTHRQPSDVADQASGQGPIVELDSVGRDYQLGPHVVRALRDIHLRVNRGSLVVVHGRSGSGKTTLLNVIGGLDRPTAGTASLDGHVLGSAD